MAGACRPTYGCGRVPGVMRLMRARCGPWGARPRPASCRRIPGSGRTAAAGVVRTTPGGPCRVSALLASHPRLTSFCCESLILPGKSQCSKMKVAGPAYGRTWGDGACGPGAALTSRCAERKREEGTTRDRAPLRGTAGAPVLSRGAVRCRCGECGPGLTGIRPAEMLTMPGGSIRPDARRPGRSFRSLSSPAD